MPISAPLARGLITGARIGLTFAPLLAACTAATPSPTPTPTPTPSPTPTLAPPSPSAGTFSVSPAAQAYLVPLPGYDYVLLPSAVEQQMAAGFASNPSVISVIKGYAASSVTKGGDAQAVILVLDANESFTALPGSMEQFWTGVAGSSGAPAKTTTLAGKEVRSVDGPSTKLVGWHDANLIVLVFGQDKVPTTSVAEALIKAHA